MNRKAGLTILLIAATFFGYVTPSLARDDGETSKPVLEKIVILAVDNPKKLYTENRTPLSAVLIPGWIEPLHNWQNTKDFNLKMEETRLGMGKKMNAALMEEFANEGYKVEFIEGPKGPPDDPETVEYGQLGTDGPILHLWFETVGMYSGKTSLDYTPRVNVTVYLVHPKDEEYLYSETLYYGADSRGEDYWSIPADPKYKYRSAAALLEKSSEVAEIYDEAITKIAQHLAKEFKKQFIQAQQSLSLTSNAQ